MQKSFDSLIETNDPRSFLKKALQLRTGELEKINISHFSKEAGFSSRSFLSEYLTGKKNLSLESLNKLKKALSLPKDYSLYFQYLVFQEQPELFQNETNKDASEELKSIKDRILFKKNPDANKTEKYRPVLAKRQAMRIFSALNTAGASFFEITAKTRLEPKVIQNSLALLTDLGLVHFQEDKYFPAETKLDFFHFTNSELVDLTKDISQEISRDAAKVVQDPNQFTFYSTLSVRKKNLPEIKEKIRSAIYEILDQYQDDQGDSIEQVFICLKS